MRDIQETANLFNALSKHFKSVWICLSRGYLTKMLFEKNVDDYFMSTIRGDEEDTVKSMLGLPVSIPIFTLYYSSGGRQNAINVYPTVQFMYSHHINPKYITYGISLYFHAGIPDGVLSPMGYHLWGLTYAFRHISLLCDRFRCLSRVLMWF